MMGKKLRNLALLGGLGAAAYMMGSKKGDSKKDVDTTADASAGQAKDRLGGAGFDRGDKDTTGDMSAGQAKDRLKDLNVAPVKKAKKTDTKPAAVTKAPTRTVNKKEEGRTASGLPREARGVGPGRPKDVSTAGAIQAANQGIPPTPAGSTNIPTTRSPTSRAGAKGRDPSRYGKPVTLDELFKKGGSVKSSASKRADGIAVKGKTRGRMV
jgi:hypothetical protein